MSGSGGFNKYRCKNFYTNLACTNWVYVNNQACAYCLAEGLDSQETLLAVQFRGAYHEVSVPRVIDGLLEYTVMEALPPEDPVKPWALRLTAPRPQISTVSAIDTPNIDLPSSHFPAFIGM